MQITSKEFNSAYSYFKQDAVKYLESGNYEESLNNIETCAKLAYSLNTFYVDYELELILTKNATQVCGENVGDFSPVKGRYVLIDTNGSDNHGLSQQYIRGLIHAGVEFAYVYLESDYNRAKLIFDEVRSYDKASLITFKPEHTYIQKAKIIIEFLADYKPEKFIMHIMPWDVVSTMVCSLLKNVTIYNINATDHAFWIGASYIDYLIEFRDYGYSVSLDKRGLTADQLLLLPYYPLVNEISFKGFPETTAKYAVKIFSGGSFYKVYGEKGAYFKMVKQVLADNPNAVLLYAGTGNSAKMKTFIEKNKLEDRFFLLGNRADIYNVFKNCDIFLATYPVGGGLMSQLAAICGKPILAYTDADLAINYIEGVICHTCDCRVSFTAFNDFYNYAKKLCSDQQFRNDEGNKLINCVISPDSFNAELKYLLDNNKTRRHLKRERINYERISEVYLEAENYFLKDVQMLIVSKLKLKAFYRHPKMIFNLADVILKKLLKTN